MRDRAEALRSKGKRPYVIPLGLGNKPLGALGYMDAATEILRQQTAPFDVIITPSGSGLTHSGLLAGLRAAGDQTRVVGGCVRRAADLSVTSVSTLTDVSGSGDTLSGIAQRFNVSLSDLKNRNGISGSKIRVGQKLVIPTT